MNYEVINGDNINILKNYPDNYFDSVVTDPPYGLGKEPNANELMKDWIEHGYHEIEGKGFMGKEWDAFVPQPIFWKEVFRVLKPGGHVLAFYGTRTYDWGVMAMRFAGFEVRDCIQWLYGSGFPKSHNIGKAIDKIEGNERQSVDYKYQNRNPNGKNGISLSGDDNLQIRKIDGDTKGNSKWEGWGTALKPANEPIVLARKPLEKGLSIAENILKWGVGGINIDASRIGNETKTNSGKSNIDNDRVGAIKGYTKGVESEIHNYGRFPANIILTHHEDCVCKGTKKVKGNNNPNWDYKEGADIDNNVFSKGYKRANPNFVEDADGNEIVENWDCHQDCPIRILDEQSGVTKSAPQKRTPRGVYQGNSLLESKTMNLAGLKEGGGNFNDKGGASRFFYVAKASKSERNKGLDGFEEKEKPDNYIMRKLTCSECGRKSVDSSNSLICGCNGKTYYEEQNSLISKNNLAGNNKNFHPTVKPIKLMQYLVKMITPPKGIVLDPFCGSGTTGVACKLDGFNFVGIEQDQEYIKIAKARINNTKIELKQLEIF